MGRVGFRSSWFSRGVRGKLLRLFNRETAGETVVVILEKQIPGLSEHALARFVLRARRAAGLKGKANVLVSSSASVRLLNSRFRHQNKATDVLSFPSPGLESSKQRRLAGDIAISAQIAVRNAARLGHSAAQEIKILALHGILHLAGFDHERDNGRMARKEVQLRRTLGLPISLIERVQTAESPRTASSKTPLRTTKPGQRR
jgi:probable rRNA maturation factor